MRSIVDATAELIRKDPSLCDDTSRLRHELVRMFPDLAIKERCPNCSASMMEYVFEFDCLDALMLLYMGMDVRHQVRKGVPFTDANRIRVQHLSNATYAMKSRTTQMSKLGLIAKLMSGDKHAPGMWVITARGFAALRGERVPKRVRVWRGKIEEREADTTTLREAFLLHKGKVEAVIRRNKAPRTDYRAHFIDYAPDEWYEFAGAHQGTLL